MGGTPRNDWPGSGCASARRSRPTLVANVNSSRGLCLSTFPSRVSARPWPYRGAVSKKRMPASHARSTTRSPVASSTASKRPPSGAVPSPMRVTLILVRPSGTRSRGFIYEQLELENERHAVAALAAEVMGDGRHRRHLRLPLLVEWAARKLGDGVVIVIALDEVEQVEAVAKDHVLRDAYAADALQHLWPDRAVVLLVALLGAWFEPGVQADLHRLNTLGWRSVFESIA